MSSNFQKKSAGIIATLFIGLTIAGFIFSGYYDQGGSRVSDELASVNGLKIRQREFFMSLQQQVQFYQSMMGGKELSEEMMEQLGLKQQVLSGLINQKLLLSYAQSQRLVVADAEVTEKIQNELKNVFKDRPFTVEAYKELLKANRLSPQEFEKMMKNDLQAAKLSSFLAKQYPSEQWSKSLSKLKSKEAQCDFFVIEKGALVSKVKVSNDETQKFLASEENKNRVKGVFDDRKAQLDRPLEAKVRHILVALSEKQNAEEAEKKANNLAKKLKASNFIELAKSENDDTGSKENGGDLGFIGKGQILPELDEVIFSLKKGEIAGPIKTDYGFHFVLIEERREEKEALLADYEKTLAQELIQKSKLKELDELYEEISANARMALEKNDHSTLSQLSKDYNLTYSPKQKINLLSKEVTGVPLSFNFLKEIFSSSESNDKKIIEDKEVTRLLLAKVEKFSTTSPDDIKEKTLERNKSELQNLMSKDFMQKMIKELQEKGSVKVSAQL